MFPRILMFIIRLVFIAFLVSCFSCKQTSEKERQDALGEGYKRKKDSLEKKKGDEANYYSKFRQLNNQVNDFHGYISELKLRFKQACGDSTGHELPIAAEGNSKITNQFFFDKKGFASYLVPLLKALQDQFRNSPMMLYC